MIKIGRFEIYIIKGSMQGMGIVGASKDEICNCIFFNIWRLGATWLGSNCKY